jgi:hypothetical protein
MKSILTTGALLALATTTFAVAQSNQELAAGETAFEVQLCTSYFVVSNHCFLEQSPTTPRQYLDAAERLRESALKSTNTLAEVEASTDMPKEVRERIAASFARIQAVHSLMGTQMDEALEKNCENAAALQRRYENFCLRLAKAWRRARMECLQGSEEILQLSRRPKSVRRECR